MPGGASTKIDHHLLNFLHSEKEIVIFVTSDLQAHLPIVVSFIGCVVCKLVEMVYEYFCSRRVRGGQKTDDIA